MTKRQRKAWQERMLSQERRCFAFHGKAPRALDGSFMMSAFIKGYDTGYRAAKKKEAQK